MAPGSANPPPSSPPPPDAADDMASGSAGECIPELSGLEDVFEASWTTHARPAMPRTLPWRDVALGVSQMEALALLDARKSTRRKNRQRTTCSLCESVEPHPMQYVMLSCESETCKAVQADSECPWRGKLEICSTADAANLYECHEHFSDALSPRKATLTAEHKDFIRQLAAQGLKPLRIRNALRKRFSLAGSELADLKKVENFYNHFARTHLGHTDRYDAVAELVKQRLFTGDAGPTESFFFGCRRGVDGGLDLGDGSDAEPFMLGITSKSMLLRMDRDPASFVFHMDATFKLSLVGYPLVVMGISDRRRSFHVVALMIVSQMTEPVFEHVLASLREVYCTVARKQLRLKYVMCDADDAQFNALEKVFRRDSDFVFLMCFFHVLLNVQKWLKVMDKTVAAQVLAAVYDMHFCSSPDEFYTMREYYIGQWLLNPLTAPFVTYFMKQWLTGRYTRWQIFYTAPVYASTNNPCEQFNKTLKRDYTLRTRMKMVALLHQLLECCVNESEKARVFEENATWTPALMRRQHQLAADKLLVENEASLHARPGIVTVVASPAPRVYVESRHRKEEYLTVTAQMGVHYARMETQGQPSTGWEVDVTQRWCPCRYCFKFGVCVHLLFALQRSCRLDRDDNRILVNRRLARKRGAPAMAAAEERGKPRTNGFALSLE